MFLLEKWPKAHLLPVAVRERLHSAFLRRHYRWRFARQIPLLAALMNVLLPNAS